MDVTLDEIRQALREIVREELRSVGPMPPADANQAAERLNISKRKLDELCAAGELRPIYIGRKRLFPQEQLDSLLKRAARGEVQ